MNKAALAKRRKQIDARKPVFPIRRDTQAIGFVLRNVNTAGVKAVIATENPIERYDAETKEYVSEVLLMSGAEIRGGKDQIPIVDSHDDKTVRNIFGSIQRIKIDYANGEMFGEPIFASDVEAQTIGTRLAEGHITDFSITAIPLETLYLQRGKQYVTDRGDVIDGPALIHTRWQAINASICATGADELSTVRRSYDRKEKVTRMDEALLGQLAAMGLPEGMTDPNQVLAWVVGKLAEEKQDDAPEMVENMDAPMEETPVVPIEEKPVENIGMKDEKVMMSRQKETVEAIKRSVLQLDQKRRTEIQAACKLARLERAFADELCDGGVSLEEARKRIIERMATQPLGTSVGADVRVTESADDKFSGAIRDGLLQRSFSSARINSSPFGDQKPADGSEDFAKLSLSRLAQAVLARQGAPVERMSNREIAMAALGHKATLSRYRIERSEAYHTTGNFPSLMLDAANKTLLAAYEEAPYTWNLWARQATSVEDFKTINRIRFSESPDLEMVPEGKEYPEKSISDSRESYRVEKYGALFTVSWETVVNDDLDAISRVPAMHGNAARRVQNKKVYEVLTSNPTMGDTFALFSSSHPSGDNTSGSAGAPAVGTLNTGFAKMMLQKGQSGAILNIQPRYLIVPVNYHATALEVLGSASYIVANGNSGVKNIYGPNADRPLQVICEPQLDSASSTNWYLAADPGQTDTVELAFLSGEESPVLEQEWDYKTDTYAYKIRQTFGVKAIDWRGLFRNSA